LPGGGVYLNASSSRISSTLLANFISDERAVGLQAAYGPRLGGR